MKKYLILFSCFLFINCTTNTIRPDCSDDSIVAAQIYHLRTGYMTYIQKSVDGTHAQAYAIINGKNIPLRVFPSFAWYVLPSIEDGMGGGKGIKYTVNEFIESHSFKGRK